MPKIRHRESIAFNCSILSMPLSVRVFLLCISENGFSYAGDSAADNVLADRIALCRKPFLILSHDVSLV